MALFSYTVKDKQDKRKKGKMYAASQHEVYKQLRSQQLKVLSVEEIPETFWTQNLRFSSGIKQRDFVIYLRQFSTLIKAGITIVNATHILCQQTESKVLRKTLNEIEINLRAGISLSDAYEKFPKLFKPLFINMIKAGEASGTIDETLERLANYYDKQYRTKQKVISALTYPIILALATVGVVTFLLVYIVPIFVDLFVSLDTELPVITRLVLNVSHNFQIYYGLILVGIGLMIIALAVLKQLEKGQYLIDQFLLKAPIFGKLFQKSAMVITASTLASLFASSVPALQAVEITEKVVGNQVIASVLHKGRDALERGDSLTKPMKEHWAIPPLVSQMIMIGEETGSLDTMLAEIAGFYEAEVEATTDRLKALIEPIMIFILAGIVGLVVVSIMIPMFKLFNGLG